MTDETPTVTLNIKISHTELFNFLKKTGDLLATQPNRLGENGVETYKAISSALVEASDEQSLKGIISGALEINPASPAVKPLLQFTQNTGNETEG